MDSRRAQGSFEYVLMLSGVLLVVITMVFVLQGTTSSANNTVGNTMKTAGTLVDSSYYIPGAKPVFLPSTPADGAWGTSQPNISAVITVNNVQLTGVAYGWNGVNYSFYDPPLVLSLGLNDNPLIGETASKAVDISQYGSNGTVYDETLGLWHMDENTGNTIYDETARKNNGTCYNMSGGSGVTNCNWVAGKSGSGIQFDGIGTYINTSLSMPTATMVTTGVTYSAWIRTNAPASGSQIILFQDTHSGCSNVCVGGIYVTSGLARMQTYNNTVYLSATSSGSVNDGAWHYIVGTFDPVSKNINLYVDGMLNGTVFVNTIYNIPTRNVMIGAFTENPGGSIGWVFNGTIDEAEVINRTLSLTEIQNNYNAGRAKRESWTPSGVWNGATKFYGATEYVNCGSSPNYNSLLKNITIEYWYKNNGANIRGYTEDIVSMRQGFNVADGAVLYANLAGQSDRNLAGFSLPDSLYWHFYAFTYDSSTTIGKAYLDGVLVNTRNASANYPGLATYVISTTSNPLTVSHPSYTVNGSVEEVRIWNRALSPQEIAVHYASDLYEFNNNTWYFSNNNANLSTGGYSYVLYTNSSNNGPNINMATDSRTVHVCTIPFVPC